MNEKELNKFGKECWIFSNKKDGYTLFRQAIETKMGLHERENLR